VKTFPQPKNVRQMQSFLGIINFYRRFIPCAAKILKPLTDSLKGGQKKQLEWSVEMHTAFADIKAALCASTLLAHPDQRKGLCMAVDASDSHVGAVLQQGEEGRMQPLAFFSKKLDSTQQQYSMFDRELLACYKAVRHFRWLLEGRRFHILSDHKPLSFALHKVADAWSARQQRQLSYVVEFTSDIRHVPGCENMVADMLSGPAMVIAAALPYSGGEINYEELAAAQSTCAEVADLLRSPSLHVRRCTWAGVDLWCDLSTVDPRPVVPVEYRRKVFHAVHSLAHAGIRATRRLVSSRFVWRGMANDVHQWCRECLQCARGKGGGTIPGQVQPIQVPQERFLHVHVDLVGPLPVSPESHTYVLSVIDWTTRWPELFPLRDVTAATCVDTFTSGWVAHYGVPTAMTTDRGVQFTSELWHVMCRTLGIRHILTTAYHPQSNRMVERLHRQVKDSLRARGCGAAWLEHLPWVLLGIRAAPKEECNVSPAEAVFGVPLMLPGQAARPQEHGQVPVIATRARTYAEVTRPHPRPDFVFIRRGQHLGVSGPVFDGPYKVVKWSDKYYDVLVGQKSECVSVDRVKPYVASSPPAVAEPPRRGRPPKVGAVSSSTTSTLVGGPVAVKEMYR
jgi:RNase H-like domain found in reverse transcriptase/Integrase zinc binding domain/Integrase core domain